MGDISDNTELLRQMSAHAVHVSRLYALLLLHEGQFDNRLEYGRLSYRFAATAKGIDDFCMDFYSRRLPNVHWTWLGVPEAALQDSNHETISTAIKVSITAVQILGKTLLARCHPLEKSCPESDLVFSLDDGGVTPGSCFDLPSCRFDETDPTPRKAFAGPKTANCHSAFIPQYDLSVWRSPKFSDDIDETLAYLWTLSLLESGAASLCALNAVEYDGLPLPFYVDMAKQVWDEMRHAVLCLRTVDVLIPHASSDGKVREILDVYKSTGSGLPVPLQINLYEAIWNADLEERLVLMHHDTETPGIKSLTQELHSSCCALYPEIGELFRILLRDEVTHSRIGSKWLKFLLPKSEERARVIENTRLLRSIYLLTSFATTGNISLSQALKKS